MTVQTAAPLPPEALAKMTGLEQFLEIIAGRLPPPPIGTAMNFRAVSAAEGLIVFEGEPSAAFLNPLGLVHGGWHAAMLDSVMGCAVHTTLAPGFLFTTIEMKVNYVRALLPGTGTVRAEGRVISRGARIATSEGKLLDAKGRLIAHGTETCLIFPMKDA